MMAHTCNPSTGAADPAGLPEACGQPWLLVHSKEKGREVAEEREQGEVRNTKLNILNIN